MLERTPRAAASPGRADKIHRFQAGERFLHWALALPFVLF